MSYVTYKWNLQEEQKDTLIQKEKELLKNSETRQLQMKLKEVHIIEGTTTMLSNMFDGFNKIEEIILPQSLQTMQYRSIKDMEKIERLFIPDSITHMDSKAIENCPRLKSIRCPQNMLNCIPKSQILDLEISKSDGQLMDEDIKEFESLESLILPENITKLPKDTFEMNHCPKLMELTCSISMLDDGIDEQNIKKLKIMHFPYEDEIKDDYVDKLQQIYDIKVKYGTQIPDMDKVSKDGKNKKERTEVKDIVDFDENNKQYEIHISNILTILDNLKGEDLRKMGEKSKFKSLFKKGEEFLQNLNQEKIDTIINQRI